MVASKILVGLLLAVWLCLSGSIAPAWASIHTYPEAEQQTLFRSRLSAPDNQQQAWQIIMFKRMQAGQVKSFQLRLVGFPGQVKIEHPADLTMTDRHDSTWQLADVTTEDPQLEPVQDSVGQYDLWDVMESVTQAHRLDLEIALTEDETRHIVIPQSMVREWLSVKEMMD